MDTALETKVFTPSDATYPAEVRWFVLLADKGEYVVSARSSKRERAVGFVGIFDRLGSGDLRRGTTAILQVFASIDEEGEAGASVDPVRCGGSG